MKRVLMMLFLAVGLNLGYTLNAATAIGVISLETVSYTHLRAHET